MQTAIAFLAGVIGMALVTIRILRQEKDRDDESAPMGWVARDRDGELWLHQQEPVKDYESGQWLSHGVSVKRIDQERFKSVYWTDERAKPVKLTLDYERRWAL